MALSGAQFVADGGEEARLCLRRFFGRAARRHHLVFLIAPVGDVAQQHYDLVTPSRRAALDHRRQGCFDPAELGRPGLAVFVVAHADFDHAGPAAMVHVGEGREVGGTVEHVDAFDETIARQFIALAAEKLFRGA